jgi:hypothetical protein
MRWRNGLSRVVHLHDKPDPDLALAGIDGPAYGPHRGIFGIAALANGLSSNSFRAGCYLGSEEKFSFNGHRLDYSSKTDRTKVGNKKRQNFFCLLNGWWGGLFS